MTDRHFAGCLWAAFVRCPHPRAEVVDIDAAAVLTMEGVEAVFTWADVPDVAINPALTPPDEVSAATSDKRMLTRSPRHVGDEVAVVVARSRTQAYRAAAQARVTWSPANSVLTLDQAVAARRFVGRFNFGDPRARDRAHAAQLTVSETFSFAAAQHTCLETPACVALPVQGGTAVEIWTNSQCPAEVRSRVASVLSLDEQAVRIRKVDEGGGFGAKQDLYAEALAGWLALRLGRPVRFCHTRREELTAGRVRARGRIELAMGFDRSGVLLATDMSAVLDCGAYVSHTPYVLSCMPGHVAAVYPRAAHRFTGTLVGTDTIPSGAYRGYGVAEANFAVEQLMDVAASRLGLSPIEIRLRNLVTDRAGRSVEPCLRELADGVPPSAQTEGGHVRRGRGIAVAAKHSVTAVDSSDASTAEVTLHPGPTLLLTTGTCDSGTGSNRALARIVADELGAPLDVVLVGAGDTDRIADLGSTAQRSVFVGGEAARQAARQARADIVRVGSDGRGGVRLDWPYLVDAHGQRVIHIADLAAAHPDGSVGGLATARAPGRGASYCAVAVEVRVDIRTGAVQVTRADAVVDCGQVVNHAGAYGQVAGGIIQGIGLACTDQWSPGPGGAGPGSMLEHAAPRAADAPVVSVTFHKDDTGQPSGLGELPIVPVAAAVSNAVAAATGVRCTHTPLRPGVVWRCLTNQREAPT